MQCYTQMKAESPWLVCLARNEKCGRPAKTLLAKRTQTRPKTLTSKALRQNGALRYDIELSDVSPAIGWQSLNPVSLTERRQGSRIAPSRLPNRARMPESGAHYGLGRSRRFDAAGALAQKLAGVPRDVMQTGLAALQVGPHGLTLLEVVRRDQRAEEDNREVESTCESCESRRRSELYIDCSDIVANGPSWMVSCSMIAIC